MVEAAERSGALQAGRHHRGADVGQHRASGLAIVAAEKGYRCLFVCPDKVGQDKISVLRAYGAEVVVCPTTVSPDHPDSYYSVSDRLARETPGGWKPNQYANAENPQLALSLDRPGDLDADRGPGHPLRRRHRHRRHDLGRPAATSRKSPVAASRSSAPTRRARSTRAVPAARTWSRASARTSGRRPTTRASATRSSPSATRSRSS